MAVKAKTKPATQVKYPIDWKTCSDLQGRLFLLNDRIKFKIAIGPNEAYAYLEAALRAIPVLHGMYISNNSCWKPIAGLKVAEFALRQAINADGWFGTEDYMQKITSLADEIAELIKKASKP